MNFLLLSDFHLVTATPTSRLDDLPRTQFRKLIFILLYAQKHNCKIVQAGDLSEVPRSWYLLPRIAIYLKKYRAKYYGIFGQHDTYLYSELTRDATTLGVLDKTGLVTILGDEPVKVGNVRLWGASYGRKVPKIKKVRNVKDMLVVHDHISDKALFSAHRYKKAKTYLKKHRNFDLILAGDIHRQFRIKLGSRRIVNTGPIVRTDNTEYNREHRPSFYVWNSRTNRIKTVIIPHEKTEEIFLDKAYDNERDDASSIVRSIDLIRKSKEYKVANRLSDVILDLYDEYSVTEEVQDLLSELLL